MSKVPVRHYTKQWCWMIRYELPTDKQGESQSGRDSIRNSFAYTKLGFLYWFTSTSNQWEALFVGAGMMTHARVVWPGVRPVLSFAPGGYLYRLWGGERGDKVSFSSREFILSWPTLFLAHSVQLTLSVHGIDKKTHSFACDTTRNKR